MRHSSTGYIFTLNKELYLDEVIVPSELEALLLFSKLIPSVSSKA
jgi:hypothetical protein